MYCCTFMMNIQKGHKCTDKKEKIRRLRDTKGEKMHLFLLIFEGLDIVGLPCTHPEYSDIKI